jgi:hypothetical protein
MRAFSDEPLVDRSLFFHRRQESAESRPRDRGSGESLPLGKSVKMKFTAV